MKKIEQPKFWIGSLVIIDANRVPYQGRVMSAWYAGGWNYKVRTSEDEVFTDIAEESIYEVKK